MRALILGGTRGQWNFASPPSDHRLTNGVEGWTFALQGDYLNGSLLSKEHLTQYDLIVANLNPVHFSHYLPLVENRPANVRWVSLIEGGGEDYFDVSPTLQRILDASDLIAVINQRTTGYFRAMTKAKVAWIGIPFPYETLQTFATPPEQRRREVLVCPRKQRYPSLVAAEALGLPISAFLENTPHTVKNVGLFLRRGSWRKDFPAQAWTAQQNCVPRIGYPECDLPDFWRIAGGCALWVDLDPRTTWARFVLDAAALGVPIVATESTDHAPLLFPETTVRDVFCVEEAIAIGKRLLAEPDWAISVTEKAREKLPLFTPEACVQRLKTALGIE